MRQTEGINQSRKDKHLNWEERIQIEILQREGYSGKGIGGRIGRPARTINRELARGWVIHRTGQYSAEERYSADRGQTIYDRRMSGRTTARPMDKRLTEHLQARILKHRESPEVVAAGMRRQCLEYAVCAKTIYNLIDRGMVPGVNNESLWEKRKRRNLAPIDVVVDGFGADRLFHSLCFHSGSNSLWRPLLYDNELMNRTATRLARSFTAGPFAVALSSCTS